MSYLVCTMKKMKRGNLTGLQKHSQREYENHKNKDIDPERTHLNYDLANDDKINFLKKTTALIEKRRESKKAVRKDAVMLNEFIIGSDNKFFKNMSDDEMKKFFKTSKDFFAERYGKENIISANVHLDETTPHMHLDVCPLRDGKLQGKNVFTRNELRKLQDILPKTLHKEGFDIERGVKGSTRKHVDIETIKAIQNKELEELELKVANRKKELEELDSNIKPKKNKLENIDTQIDVRKTVLANLKKGDTYIDEDIKFKEKHFQGYVQMDINNFKKFMTQVASSKNITKENKELKEENKNFKNANKKIMKSQENLCPEFTKWIDRVHRSMPFDTKDNFKKRSSQVLADMDFEKKDSLKTITLDKAVMDSKAFDEDEYINTTKNREKDLETPENGFKYNKNDEIEW